MAEPYIIIGEAGHAILLIGKEPSIYMLYTGSAIPAAGRSFEEEVYVRVIDRLFPIASSYFRFEKKLESRYASSCRLRRRRKHKRNAEQAAPKLLHQRLKCTS
jgi:hypothetical protein